MADDEIARRISELVDQEHALREQHVSGEAGDDERAQLASLEVELDRCWDLLRQRRARREAHQDEGQASARSGDVVEHYQQ